MEPDIDPQTRSSVRLQLRELRASGGIEFYERVDLRAWTSLRVGGPADLVVRCRTRRGTADAVDLLAAHGLTWLVIGTGSRLVVPDRGLRVPVVTLGGELAGWTVNQDSVAAGAGASLASLARAMLASGRTGLERLIGTAGSLGGALADHRITAAGCPGLRWLELVEPGRAPRRLDEPGHVAIELGPRAVVTRAELELGRDPQWRLRPARGSGPERAPLDARPSVFRAPADSGRDPVELIRASRCTRIFSGAVRLDDQRPDVLYVGRSATAADVLSLCRQVVQRVVETTGVPLELALLPVNECGRPRPEWGSA